ncbi:MAG: alpha/beta hydrolase family protein [Calditrichia bacterium]
MSSFNTKTIQATDGYPLAARFYTPTGTAKAAIFIASAMGVKQRYYESFAEWLATQGYMVQTFDYRGIGDSLNGKLKDVEANIVDWAEKDCSAVLKELTQQAKGIPIYWIGHSLGGQLFPLISNADQISKMITVAAGSGYWRENAPSLRRTVWWLWYVMAPLSIKLFGYFPGRRLRKVGDLPAGVMNQWRSWCLNSEYAPGVEGEPVRSKFEAVHIPITSLSFSDDQYMSKRNVESLHGFYKNAAVRMKRIAPQEIDVKSVGHFGFFKDRFKDSLWEDFLLPELSLES